jgi:hypothetical protein
LRTLGLVLEATKEIGTGEDGDQEATKEEEEMMIDMIGRTREAMEDTGKEGHLELKNLHLTNLLLTRYAHTKLYGQDDPTRSVYINFPRIDMIVWQALVLMNCAI